MNLEGSISLKTEMLVWGFFHMTAYNTFVQEK